MTSDVKIFSIILSSQLNFGVLPFKQLFYFFYKRKTPLFLNLAVFIVA